MLEGRADFLKVSSRCPHVLKIADTKFLTCPLQAVPAATWELLALITDATDQEGNIRHLPYSGGLLDQPAWFRQAVHILRAERAAPWLAAKIKQQEGK